MRDVVRQALEAARALGAGEASARGTVDRRVSVDWRDGELESIKEATHRALTVELYIDGRFGTASTSDLRPDAVQAFLARAAAMTRALAPDPDRRLPDPALYRGRTEADLELDDAAYERLTPDRRRDLARTVEAAARAEAIVSVTASVSDTRTESWQVHSNGFEGHTRTTAFWLGALASARDPGGGKPQEGETRGARHLAELPDAAELGRKAAARALGRIGTRKLPSGTVRLAVDNRVAGRLVTLLVRPMMAAALQQKQSFLDGKLGARIGSPLLTLTDEPLLARALGSRPYDDEGLAARRLPLVQAGVLAGYLVDTYYGRKLGLAPTTGGTSNLVVAPGTRSQPELLADLGDGVLVTGFLGGNSNSTTGDFSLGISGFEVRGGALAGPIGEMNLAGNQLELWSRLVAVGDDPWRYSSLRTPTLVFERAVLAGS